MCSSDLVGGEKIIEQQTGRSAGSAVWVQMSSRVMIRRVGKRNSVSPEPKPFTKQVDSQDVSR